MAHEAGPDISISEQAARWWVLFNEPGAQALEHREFADWVARSPERVEAYLRVARLHQTLGSHEVRWPATSAEELIREAQAANGEVCQLLRRSPAEQSSSPRVWLKAAACVLLACAASWYFLNRPQQFQTKFGEQRSVTLADGSRITLNTASQVEVDLRRDGRLIRLLEGEALFEVAHDPKRPFDVRVGGVTLRAVGTQFDVDLRSSSTTVTVVDGRVAVDAGTGSGVGPARGRQVLEAADRLVIGHSHPGVTQHGVNVAAILAWTQHQLVFEKRPLGEVAEEFNRYNRRHIVIGDAGLRLQEVTGVFQSNDPDSFVAFLSGIPGVLVRDDGQGGALVTLGRPAGPSK
jgi:transmembrane sensor